MIRRIIKALVLTIVVVLGVWFAIKNHDILNEKETKDYNYYYFDFVDNQKEYNQLINELEDYTITSVSRHEFLLSSCNEKSEYYIYSSVGFCATQKVPRAKLKEIVSQIKKLNIEEVYYNDDIFDRYKYYRIIHLDSSLRKTISLDYYLYDYKRKDVLVKDCMNESCEYNASKVIDSRWIFNYMEISSEDKVSIPLEEFNSILSE